MTRKIGLLILGILVVGLAATEAHACGLKAGRLGKKATKGMSTQTRTPVASTVHAG